MNFIYLKKRIMQSYKLSLYFLKLGTFGFGGPIALAETMERDLVYKEKIISAQTYKEGLTLSQIAPGPLATQLAMYIGYVTNGFIGATMISFAFLLPSFIMVLILSWLYVHFHGMPLLQPLFYGIGAAVIGIIVKSSYKLLKSILTGKVLWAIAILMGIAVAVTKEENILLFASCGIFFTVYIAITGKKSETVKTPESKSPINSILPPIPVLGMLSSAGSIITIFLFFAQASLFVFGSGLAVIPFLYGGTVVKYHWLNERQFLDAVAIAMITPGPVVITVAFIGYLIAGFKGAIAAALGIFLPVYLVTIIAVPWFNRIKNNRYIMAFVNGVSAAAVGALAGSVFILGSKSIIDIPTLAIFAATLVIVFLTEIPEPVIIIFAGIIGLFLKYLHL